jgi:ABC-type dipeptide/oligopeptide/nickel transport system permease subunit
MSSRALRRLRRNRFAMLGGLTLVAFVLVALLAPYLAPHDPLAQNRALRKQGPSWQHPLGLDALGRDLLSRLIHGARISLKVGLLVVSISAVVGTLVGAAAGYLGGLADEIVMRLVDILLAFPGLLLAIALVAVLGPNLNNVILALCIMGWVGFARLARGQALALREIAYVEAARSLGAGPGRIILTHIIPNLLAPVIVQATLGMAGAIIAEAGLSFLGLGVQPPQPSWGSILQEGASCLREAPHIATFSGLAIMLVVLGLNFLGDGLRDALDPKMDVTPQI